MTIDLIIHELPEVKLESTIAAGDILEALPNSAAATRNTDRERAKGLMTDVFGYVETPNFPKLRVGSGTDYIAVDLLLPRPKAMAEVYRIQDFCPEGKNFYIVIGKLQPAEWSRLLSQDEAEYARQQLIEFAEKRRAMKNFYESLSNMLNQYN